MVTKNITTQSLSPALTRGASSDPGKVSVFPLKPFHLFSHKDGHYVINIEDMRAGSIDEAGARALAMLVDEPGAPMDSHLEAQLKKLGLLSSGAPKKTNEVRKEQVPIVNSALFLTQSCNLKCVYCYGDGGGYGTGGELEEKTAFRAVDWLIDQSGKMKKIHVGFFGGEPFLNFPLMKSVVAYARKRAQETDKDVDFNITTNGTLLDDEKIAFIKEYEVTVLISFDGPREIQDAQRPFANGKGSYDAIVPGIKKLLAVEPETPGHAVLCGNTDPRLVKDAMQEIGFTNVSAVPASASLFDGQAGAAAPKRDTETMLNRLERESEACVHHIKNRDSESLKALTSKSQLYQGLISLLHNSKRRHACGAGLRMVGVSCAGDVYLCHRFVGMDEYRLGSVFSHDLDREKYGKSPVTFIEQCVSCFARYYCAGGCKHDNAGSCGSVFTPSEDMCRLTCRELELAAVVCAGLTPADSAFLAERDIVPPKPCPLDF